MIDLLVYVAILVIVLVVCSAMTRRAVLAVRKENSQRQALTRPAPM
jgi:heme exporter protein D